jgi:hypothetical protein
MNRTINIRKEVKEHYEKTDRLMFERFGKNYDMKVFRKDGSVVTYNLERVRKGYLSVGKYFEFDGNQIKRVYDGKIMETGF